MGLPVAAPRPPWWKRLWWRIFGRKLRRSKPGVPPSHTLVMRVAAAEDEHERQMLRLAEEAIQRGHPEQAAIVYRKAAERFKKEGKAHKQVAVLNQLVRLYPNDPAAYAELMDAYEAVGRRQDALLSGTRSAALYRHKGDVKAADNQQARVVALQSGDGWGAVTRSQQGLQPVPARPSVHRPAPVADAPSPMGSGWTSAPIQAPAVEPADSGPVELDMDMESSQELVALRNMDAIPTPQIAPRPGLRPPPPAPDPLDSLIVPLPAAPTPIHRDLVLSESTSNDTAPTPVPEWTDDDPSTHRDRRFMEDTLQSVSDVGFSAQTDEMEDMGAATIAMPAVTPHHEDNVDEDDSLPEGGAATIAMPPIFQKDTDPAMATLAMAPASKPPPYEMMSPSAGTATDSRVRPDSEMKRQLAALDADTMPEQETDEGDRTVAMPPVQVPDDTGMTHAVDPRSQKLPKIPNGRTQAYDPKQLSRLLNRNR